MTDYTRNSPPRRSGIEHRITLLLVFSVTPFKINQNQNQNSSNDEVQNLEEKEGKYAKTFAKIQVTAMFLTQDMRRTFLPKFIEILMETPCWRPSGWRPKPTETFVTEFCYKSVKLISSGTQKHFKNNTFLIHELFSQIPRNKSLF